MAFDLTPEQRQDFAEALYGERKIEAIKQLRELSGLGLEESKEIIERLETELRTTHPERFAKPKKSGGRLLLLIVLFPVGVLIWFIFAAMNSR